MTGLKTFYISHLKRKVEDIFLKLKVILKKLKPKYCFFILNYTKILPKSFLLKNNLNLVVHTSDLKGKGLLHYSGKFSKTKQKFQFVY